MGPTRASRKGKKAWRKNIDDGAVVDALAQETLEERRAGPAVETLADEKLFTVDRKPAAKPEVKTKKQRMLEARSKLTRAEAIIQQASQAKPVLRTPKPKPKSALPAPLQERDALKQRSEEERRRDAEAKERRQKELAKDYDVFQESPKADREDKQRALIKEQYGTAKRRRKATIAPIPAVEVDIPGCSYNPTYDDHQDAVALAVAHEMNKVIAADLAPTAPPRVLPADAPADPQQDPLALLQHDAEASDSEPEDAGSEGEDVAPQKRPEKKTRAQRNKERRVAEEAARLAARRALKKQRREIDGLGRTRRELEEEEADREVLRARREAMLAERALQEPPRLGRHKFEPAPVEVLPTDELPGSMRGAGKGRGAAAALRDRFSSLQKRGRLEVRKVVEKQKVRKRRTYVHGAKADAERERMAEIWALQARNRDRKKAAVAQAAIEEL
ncbi:unnamed protein product [Pedinophyceae sp. YPF-701]|nr:unnamed protein product [Pedinophyceae sp. YPF-701]